MTIIITVQRCPFLHVFNRHEIMYSKFLWKISDWSGRPDHTDCDKPLPDDSEIEYIAGMVFFRNLLCWWVLILISLNLKFRGNFIWGGLAVFDLQLYLRSFDSVCYVPNETTGWIKNLNCKNLTSELLKLNYCY